MFTVETLSVSTVNIAPGTFVRKHRPVGFPDAIGFLG
jgi:hypothetical protein